MSIYTHLTQSVNLLEELLLLRHTLSDIPYDQPKTNLLKKNQRCNTSKNETFFWGGRRLVDEVNSAKWEAKSSGWEATCSGGE